ncbi:MAG: electron transfer flavoprotein-ubiquinone oxidoreductase [Desulfobacterales bacterium]|nr:electron transfer flavoprotein-ubiquinone oxidoreductase [Desulfobacterales bacterium]
MDVEREQMEFDVLFVGGGPANLAGAIRLMNLAKAKNIELEIAVIEKGAEIGSHALSGAVLNPIALKELVPDYQEKGCPVETTVRGDAFYFLTKSGRFKIPFTPKYMHNTGFHIVSLSRLTRWMGEIAEEMGINVFPGFAGKEVLYGEDDKTITGVRTDDKGLDPEGNPKNNFEPGIDLMAKVTVFGEGARGSLQKTIEEKLGIASGKMPQVYETGIKEVIELPENNYFTKNNVNDIHMMGYPLGIDIPGGAFIYEMKDNRITLGLLIGLCYDDPMLDPYNKFIKFKQHPFVANIIKGGKVIEQGARTVSTGSYYTIPELAVDGGMFVGAAAAMHNTPALKGIHVSMKSGMLAADAIIEAIEKENFSKATLSKYADLFEKNWAKNEIFEGRNTAQALAKKGIGKFVHLGAQYISNGRGIIDPMPLEDDSKTLKSLTGPLNEPEKLQFDDKLCVDKLTGVYLSKTMHREDQPCHIIVHDQELCVTTCYEKYKNPCVRFCPGDVYEIEKDESTGKRKLKLNFSNCLHCKTCDIKDPLKNVTWTCPEGGEGPGYSMV